MRFSASRMGLADHCIYWAGDDIEHPADDDSPAAEIGRWYHAVCCWTISVAVGVLPPDSPIPAAPACLGDANELTPEADAHQLLSEYPGTKIRAEVAYVYSPRGTRHAGFDIGRDYGEVGPDEIPGTADVVILDIEANRAFVVDWKSGQRTDSARVNRQLAILALMVHEFHGVDLVEVQLRYGDGWIDRHAFDAFDLVEVKDSIDQLIASSFVAANRVPRPGLHCTARYCPIRATCPATVEAVAEVLDDINETSLAVIARGTSSIANADHAASLWNRAAVAQTLLDEVVKAVKSYVDANGPIPLGDGKELACVDETRESIDASTIQAIYDPIAQYLTAESFAECILVSVPKGALEKRIKECADRGKKTLVWEAAIESLRTAGQLKTKTITRHRVRKIKTESAKKEGSE